LQIPGEPLLHPLRKFVPAAHRQGKRQLRTVRERQQSSPFCVRNAAKITPAIFAQTEAAEDRKQRSRHSTPPADERSQNAFRGIQVVIA
jgi:hypothetical protein